MVAVVRISFALREDLAGLGVDDVVREHLADQVVGRHRQAA